jgi:hypothetical protein
VFRFRLIDCLGEVFVTLDVLANRVRMAADVARSDGARAAHGENRADLALLHVVEHCADGFFAFAHVRFPRYSKETTLRPAELW